MHPLDCLFEDLGPAIGATLELGLQVVAISGLFAVLGVLSMGIGAARIGRERRALPSSGSKEGTDWLGMGLIGLGACLVVPVVAARIVCRVSSADPGVRLRTRNGTLCVVAKTVPVRELRNGLARLLDEIADRREHVVVTRRGRPAAVLIPIDEYEALEETAEILSDPDALAAIEAGLAELERGEAVTLEEVRRELAQRRQAR